MALTISTDNANEGATDTQLDDSPSTASPPFCKGDVILRTADQVDFHVYRIVLSLASPFFESMFSLQQPEATLPDATPVIPITEDSVTLDFLLRYCYPVRSPGIRDLALLSRVLEAAIKYDMEEPTYLVKQTFRELMKESPLHAYAISCILHCEEEASLAAGIWKATRTSWDEHADDFLQTLSGASYIPEMGDLSAGCYYRLLSHLRGDSITSFCDPPEEEEYTLDASCQTDNPEANESNADEGAAPHGEDSRSETPSSSDLTSKYPFTLPDPDLIVRSSDGVDFPVHRLMLRMNISRDIPSDTHVFLKASNTRLGDIPVAIIPEDSVIASLLLTLCYPAEPGSETSIPYWTTDEYCDNLRIIRVAQRYGMLSIVDSYKAHFVDHVHELPLDTYCVAVAMGWEEKTEDAAEVVATGYMKIIGYASLMETIPASSYHRLLSYCHRYRSVQMKIMLGLPWCPHTSAWRDLWYKEVDRTLTFSRWVPSIVAERALAGGYYSLGQLLELSKEMRVKVDKVVDKEVVF